MQPTTTDLFTPLQVGAMDLPNRIVMAPMTRSRAGADGVASPFAPVYYAQRAGAGLIVTEGTQPSAAGQGYARTPGIHSAAQVAAWRAVTDAVHARGGRIVLQLMHVGRVAHRLNRSVATAPVAPSAVRAPGKIRTDQEGAVDLDMPRALATAEVAEVVAEHRDAAARAMTAGFDGVELHAAGGYIAAQFLASNTNQRTDRYGGSLANRARFAIEVLEAMADGAGSAARVGMKISPGLVSNGVDDADPAGTAAHLVGAIGRIGLAYLHVMRPPAFLQKEVPFDALALVRPLFRGPVIAGGDLDGASAGALLRSGRADLVAFGRAFIANPDLTTRLRTGAPLAAADPATFYAPGPRGYVDYPALDPAVPA